MGVGGVRWERYSEWTREELPELEDDLELRMFLA